MSLLSVMELHGFQPDNNMAYYDASTLHVIPRDRVSDHLRVTGVSIDWDHLFVALADEQQHLIYWCSENVLTLLTTLHHQSSHYAGNVSHVIVQDRHTTLMLLTGAGSHDLICLKKAAGHHWELTVIMSGNISNVSSCNVTIDHVSMRGVLVDDGNLVFLTVDHMIHRSVLPNVVVVDVSCGADHVLLLDTKGCVYSCGHGNRGQLGHDDTVNRYYPKIIELTVAMTIIKVSAGGWHSAMLSSCHDIYTYGWNCDGQLGHNVNVAMVTRPTLVAIDNDSLEFRSIACGSRHTVAISNSNDVYSWGWNKYKQLLPWQQCHHVIQDVKCGQWNTLCIT